MFKKLSETLYGGADARRVTPTSTKGGASASSGAAASASSSSAADGAAPSTGRRKSFSDRFMMSWTDEDVTFLGEDPYGDCAGNVFATVAADEARAARRASADEGRRASVDGGSRRTSENDSGAPPHGDDFEKASAFWRIGPL